MTETREPIAAAAARALDRRRFLCAAGAAAACAIGGDWLAARAWPVEPVRGPLLVPDAAALVVGTARVVSAAGGREALAVRLDATTIVAFDRRCPHLGCPVRWAAARGRFECPCHHAAFDAHTGAVLSGPPRRGLDPVEVRLA
ncbi:MAG: Rieske (2Fe-2S) protein [Candidatus Binatia bacterium]